MLPIGNGWVFWYATLNCAVGEQDREGERKANLLRLFASWREPIEQLIEATDEGRSYATTSLIAGPCEA